MHRTIPESTIKVQKVAAADLLAKILSDSEITALLTSPAKTIK